MYNPKTGDGRITGSAASLLGLEKALEDKDKEAIVQAVAKINLLHGIILTVGGIPIIYAGDEIGTLNEYTFLDDSAKKEDTRWVNRPQQDWEVVASLKTKDTPQAKIFHTLKHLISLRKQLPVFADSNNFELHYSGNEHLLVFERTSDNNQSVLVLCNFDEKTQVVDASLVKKLGYLKDRGYHNLISNENLTINSGFMEIASYQLLWLRKF